MTKSTFERELAFVIGDTARLLRNAADQRARSIGASRAQWAVLACLNRTPGVKQAELAELLDIQPITLSRLIDRLCANGLIERHADAGDRRVKRLYPTAAAEPVLERMSEIGRELMHEALQGIDPAEQQALLSLMSDVKENLKRAHTAARTARYRREAMAKVTVNG